MFGNNTAANNATSAKRVAADKERESMGAAKWQADRASKANDAEIDDWEQEKEDAAADRGDQAANLRRYDDAFLQLTTFAPIYESY